MTWDPKDRPVFDTKYWDERLQWAIDKKCLHHAVFNTDWETWEAIENKHKTELGKHIGDDESVLDVGCGYGRLLDLFPVTWRGRYLGVDVSEAFVNFAKSTYPGRAFVVGDIRDLSFLSGERYDWGIAVSVKRVIEGHAGERVWKEIEGRLLRHCTRLLYLDYDPTVDAEIVV